jgi:hypothetical protein
MVLFSFQECLMLKFVQVRLTVFAQFRFLNFLKSQTSQNSCLYTFVIFSLTKHAQAHLHISIQIHFLTHFKFKQPTIMMTSKSSLNPIP